MADICTRADCDRVGQAHAGRHTIWIDGHMAGDWRVELVAADDRAPWLVAAEVARIMTPKAAADFAQALTRAAGAAYEMNARDLAALGAGVDRG